MQIGVYLTGQHRISSQTSTNESSNDFAFLVAQKIKQIILCEIPEIENLSLQITNAIPPEDLDFTNGCHEFSKGGKRIYSLI